MTQEEADQILFQEQLIAQVLAIRSPKAAAPASKSWKELVFETAGGVALITVLLGGILGGAITTLFQYLQKRSETAHAEQQARLERQATTHERMVQAGLDASKEVFELASEAISSSDDVLLLSTKPFRASNLRAQRHNIRAKYNKADQDWRSKHVVKSLMFLYYNRSTPALSELWGKADDAVTGYLKCTDTWIEDHPFYEEGIGAGCLQERKKVDESLATLERALAPQAGSEAQH